MFVFCLFLCKRPDFLENIDLQAIAEVWNIMLWTYKFAILQRGTSNRTMVFKTGLKWLISNSCAHFYFAVPIMLNSLPAGCQYKVHSVGMYCVTQHIRRCRGLWLSFQIIAHISFLCTVPFKVIFSRWYAFVPSVPATFVIFKPVCITAADLSSNLCTFSIGIGGQKNIKHKHGEIYHSNGFGTVIK